MFIIKKAHRVFAESWRACQRIVFLENFYVLAFLGYQHQKGDEQGSDYRLL